MLDEWRCERLSSKRKKQSLKPIFFPVNDFPRKGEDANSIYTTDRKRLRVATGNNLLYAFKRCHDYTHANQGGSKEQIFWEFLKVLFAKIEDEQHGGRPRFAIRNADERNTSRRKAGSQRSGRNRFSEKSKNVFEYKNLFEAQVEGILLNAETVSFIGFSVRKIRLYTFVG